MINKVTLIGNLGKDPEVRRLESGSIVAKFSLATNENYKDKSGEWQTQTEWHTIVVWGTQAEKAEQSFRKGMTVYVEGKIKTREWEDESGSRRRTTEIVANYTRRIEGQYSNPSSGTVGVEEAAQAAEAGDDDLPF